MGSLLTPIIRPVHKIGLRGLRNKIFAVDALNAIYQFLALIRMPTGEPFKDEKGRITSHLIGLSTRYSRLAYEYHCSFIFVFDGPPHPLKKRELERRRKIREKALKEWLKALEQGRLDEAFSKAVVSSAVNEYIIQSSKKLLKLMGFPIVDAPHDAEAQAAFIVNRGDAWAANTMDWDFLLYGGERMVRYITITGEEWLPSKGYSRKLSPELIVLKEVLGELKITRKQLVEIAVLVGTDYNEGVKGIGPVKALRLVKKYGSIENMPPTIREKVDPHWREIVNLYMNPPVYTNYDIVFHPPDSQGIYEFLVKEHSFSPKRVLTVIERLEKAYNALHGQKTITGYL